MKHQTQPMAGDAGTARPAASPAGTRSAGPEEDWFDPFHDDVPERDIHADVAPEDPAARGGAGTDATGSGAAVRGAAEAESGPDSASASPPEAMPAPGPASASPPEAGPVRDAADGRPAREPEPPVSVSPAGEDSPTDAPPARLSRRTRRAAAPRVEASAAPLADATGDERPAAGVPSARAPALAVHAAGRGRRGASRRLPPGQRWKERRLPRVCWDR